MLFLQSNHGLRSLDEYSLALNLSFVLHEPSTSSTVRNAVRACRNHSRSLTRVGSPTILANAIGDRSSEVVELWLTSTIGTPQMLPTVLGIAKDRVLTVDQRNADVKSAQFFRAPSELVLPDADERIVGVAGLILRPGRQTSVLVSNGPFCWPDEQRAAIQALERLIQAHAGQWMPQRALWSAPAEVLLADEVYEAAAETRGSDDASTIS